MSVPTQRILRGANALINKEKIVLGAKRLPPLPSVTDLLKMYRIRARRQLSQNFLLHPYMCKRFVDCAGSLRDRTVVEVGPGPGNLTRYILGQAPHEVIAIEKDRHFIPTLEVRHHILWQPSICLFYLIQMTASIMDRAKDWDDICPPIKIIGNLPFNVASPLLIKWLREISEKSGPFALGRVPLILAFQKEVAERIVAPPLWDERSRLSIMSQIYCHSQIKFTISESNYIESVYLNELNQLCRRLTPWLCAGKCFSPRPQVDVSIVRMVPLRKPKIDLPFKLVEKVVRSLFQGKRKNMLGVL
ncbi:TFB1M, partial [Cordylochernes scorpioides]